VVLNKLIFSSNCELVSPFIFLEKTKQKSVSVLESLRFQGRSQRQAHCV